ncbi:MAG: hypothetical protein Q9157_008048 [Trypethelium eluteriae]
MKTRNVRGPTDLAPKICGGIITILVGKAEKRKEFYVHEDLLRSCSPYFDAALGKDWKEAGTRTISLSCDDPEAFQIYTQWLYSGKVWSASRTHDARPLSELLRMADERNLLAKAYCLGDKFLDDLFKDCIIDAILECFKVKDENKKVYLFGKRQVDFIWANTTCNAPIRRLILEQYAYRGRVSWDYDIHCKEFLVDLLREMY